MILIILLVLFTTTAFSLTCEEQFSAIDMIIINNEVNIWDNKSCPCIECQCKKYKVDGAILTSQNGCPNLHIIEYNRFRSNCSVIIDGGRSLTFISDYIISELSYVFTQYICKYEYSVGVIVKQPPPVFSLYCYDQLSSIDAISIINKIDVDNACSCTNCLLCNNYKVAGSVLISQNRCSNLYITFAYQPAFDDICIVDLNDRDYLAFANNPMNNIIYGGVRISPMGNECGYYYSIKASTQLSSTQPTINNISQLSLILSTCSIIIVIISSILLLYFGKKIIGIKREDVSNV